MRLLRDIRFRDRIYHTRRIVLALALVIMLPLSYIGISAVGWPSFETRTTSTASVPLLITMRNISEYHAATATFQTLVERDVDTVLPDFLSGEHITVYAVGNVDAQVDFGALTADAIEVSEDRRRVSIDLPAVTLTPAALDPFETRVVNRERGIVERFEDAYRNAPESNRDVFTQAQGVLNLAASRSDLRAKGEANTRAMLTGMCNSLGFTDVQITFAPPEEPKG